ncbi:MAG: hypothetical protein DRJ98_07165 [Thermoprotei archaeon]|nr:MAG: hypothetical protein DRJ98_07165 [Thermoprotei archaeon]
MEEAIRNLGLACTYGWWRTIALIVKRYGSEFFESEEWLRLGWRVGFREGEGLARLLPKKLKGLHRLLEAFKVSHWALLEHIELEGEGDGVRLKIYGCSAKNALVKWRAESYDCSRFTSKVLEGFVEGLGLKGRATCTYGPRPAPLSEVSCEWVIKLT